jgi:hypothetical protein
MTKLTSKKDQVDSKGAIAFLQQHAPEGPWSLTAIHPERIKPVTISGTFFPGQEQALLDYLDEHNGTRNIYFSINPVRNAENKKAKRDNIASLSWLHVDIDPRKQRDPYTKAQLTKEKKRLLGLVTDNRPKGVPEPTWIIHSGGGYQAAWKLEEPLKLDGSEEEFEEAKLWNMQLEVEFGGDNCHNVDRILRLPGTMNLPDARKVKAGRTATLATLVDFNENAYPLAKFTKRSSSETQAPLTVAKGQKGSFAASPTNKVKITRGAELDLFVDLDKLDEWDVPGRTRVIINNGRVPGESKEGDDSRSAWLFDCVCSLARCKVPDEIIYSILMDKEWGISESVVELGNAAHNYAIRNIERAKEYAVDPFLEQMNSQFAFIETAGTNSIVEEVMDNDGGGLDRSRLVHFSFQNIQQRFNNRMVKIGEDDNGIPKFDELGKWWLKHPERRQYHRITFAPEKVIPNVYNLWKGFACEAIPGDCDLFLGHLRDNLCSGNQEYYDYLIGWLASMVQFPARPGEVAIVLRGGRGTGKSFFAREIGKLLGRHYLQVSQAHHLTGNFNAHLRDLVLLFADEAFAARDKKHESVLKTLITEESLTIEAKGQNVINAPNYIHLIMASNDKHVIPAGEMERRFFVLEVGEGQQQNTAYFKAIADQMENGGSEALLHFLRSYDLEGFNVRKAPETKALQEQKELSMNYTDRWFYAKLQEAEILPGLMFGERCLVSALREDYYQEMQNTRAFSPLDKGQLGKYCVEQGFLRKRVSSYQENPGGDGVSRPWVYETPDIETARKDFEERFGAIDWQPVDNTRPLDEAPF